MNYAVIKLYHAGIKCIKTEVFMPAEQKDIESRRLTIMRKKNIMLKITDILMQKQLITPEEKIRLTAKIKQEDET